nr:GDSL esterase/lipase CPRD49-like isoform X2 [Ipomoea batatas]
MRKIAIHLKSLSEKTRVIFLSAPPVNEAQILDRYGDGIHLSSEGSNIVVKEILKVVKEAEWKPSLHWRSMASEFWECLPFIPAAHDSNGNGNKNLPVDEPVGSWQTQWL